MSPADVVALPGWRWSRGMTAIRTVAGGCDSGRVVVEDVTADSIPVDGSWVPDRTDAATLGCLMELVETALGAPIAVVPVIFANTTIEHKPIRGWEVLVYRGAVGTPVPYPAITYPTKWDALVAALAAAAPR